MNRRMLWMVGAVVLAAAVGLLVWRRQGDEARLRREIRRLTEQMEKSGPESALAAANKARAIADAFAAEPRLSLSVVPYVPERRSELTSAVFQARAMVDTLSIRIHDLSVEIHPDRETAAMTLSATASARYRSESERASRAFEIAWRREPEGWRIEEIREVRSLRPLPDE